MDSASGSHAVLESDSEGAALSTTPLMVASDADRDSDVPIKKQRRVRTGCFTCRDRHLKCDEAQGQCQNCRKSGRICIRGVRLNFVDTQVVAPPTYIRPPSGSSVTFRDDSRTIASEYVGGFERYPPPQPEPPPETCGHELSTPVHSYAAGQNAPIPLFMLTKHDSNRHLSFNDLSHMSLMQIFVEKIGPWLDVVDEMKHFSRILPFYALEEPTLYAVFAACAGNCGHCGHNPNEGNNGMGLYNTAVQTLSESLRDPHRDSALCAAAAVVLEVAETLTLGSTESGKNIRAANPARSLIRECQWTTRTPGLGGVCSWLSITVELLNCLNSQRMLIWDPDTWGVDMNFAQAQPSFIGSEELWTRRMIYICAKVSDFRSSGMLHGLGKPARTTEINHRSQAWNLYNEWCENWMSSLPRSMLPLGYVESWQSRSGSIFPQIWLVGRSAILAQLFYHITQIMLIKANAVQHESASDLHHVLQHHAYHACGIVASVRNCGIPIFTTQLLAVAAGCLADREAREEVLRILDRIMRETGLKTQQIKDKLHEAWGWDSQDRHESIHTTVDPATLFSDHNPSGSGHNSFSQAEIQDSVTDPSLSFSNCLGYLDHYLTPYHEP